MENLGTNTKVQNTIAADALCKLERSLGFRLSDVTSFNRLCTIWFRPTDPSSLAVVRIMFGLLMMVDTLEERGLSEADVRWGDPNHCHFPLFHFLRPLPLAWMCLLYLLMWCGAAGMMLGLFFRTSCLCFAVPYWYIFLLDKSAWNNHSYLYGLLSILFLFTNANYFWSLDGLLGKVPENGHVPLWNYAVLRFQVFILYFIAGLKKLDRDWLNGYSMTRLSTHWLFDPFKMFLSQNQIDYWIVHLFGFMLDLTVGFFMYFDKTRPTALVLLSAFHMMNSRIFTIGMFPYVCLATMPLFCYPDWPKTLIRSIFKNVQFGDCQITNDCIYSTKIDSLELQGKKVGFSQKVTCLLILTHMFLQGFLPYSHFLTKGYNNWTDGLYGYSWDMMVHSWDTVLVVVKVVDKDTGKQHFLDPQAWTNTDRYSKHGDMMYQYAQCLRDNIQRGHPNLNNISIHMDIWCSLNKRFQQRMFDPRVDLLTVDWTPFTPVSWLMPLLTDLTTWRDDIAELEHQVHSWSNHTDTLFVADFPGLHLENYIHKDLTNVSVTGLAGDIFVEIDQTNKSLNPGENIYIPERRFHKIYTVSETPSCYMYVYTNNTSPQPEASDPPVIQKTNQFARELWKRWENFKQAVRLVSNALLHVFFSLPMAKQVRTR